MVFICCFILYQLETSGIRKGVNVCAREFLARVINIQKVGIRGLKQCQVPQQVSLEVRVLNVVITRQRHRIQVEFVGGFWPHGRIAAKKTRRDVNNAFAIGGEQSLSYVLLASSKFVVLPKSWTD